MTNVGNFQLSVNPPVPNTIDLSILFPSKFKQGDYFTTIPNDDPTKPQLWISLKGNHPVWNENEIIILE